MKAREPESRGRVSPPESLAFTSTPLASSFSTRFTSELWAACKVGRESPWVKQTHYPQAGRCPHPTHSPCGSAPCATACRARRQQAEHSGRGRAIPFHSEQEPVRESAVLLERQEVSVYGAAPSAWAPSHRTPPDDAKCA